MIREVQVVPMRNENENLPPVEIPPDSLDAGTLKAVVDSFIFRDGTDYGWQEVHHDTKSEQVLRQIAKGHVKIIFDPNTESITLMTEKEWKKLQASQASTSRTVAD